MSYLQRFCKTENSFWCTLKNKLIYAINCNLHDLNTFSCIFIGVISLTVAKTLNWLFVAYDINNPLYCSEFNEMFNENELGADFN